MRYVHNTRRAPAPVGPYNQAVWHGDVLYISGQIAIDPDSGELQTSDIETETRRVLDNLGAILSSAGLDYVNVLKCTVFVKNMGDYERINSVYARYFAEDTAPARELVEVSHLPKGVHIEISAIAGK